ncbi:unnamed protein product [Adineta steineri]|uniref:Tryptophan 2,3-dioxygenase n=1 Tax=Adineta steineri TaxID=433720 RepID=A0A813YZB4_9BILA|nr:unnamed protein product [Adineta steineri]CAF0942413.1 unnamed protein product [Adineta steineri]
MPCPYAQLIVDDTKHINDSDDSDNSIVDEVLMTKTAVNGTGNHHQSANEPLNYATYLRTDLLLSALKCLSHTDPLDNNSPPVHDEHFFILIHQVFELWFKQLLFEIDSIRHIFTKSDNVIPSLFNINLRLKRSVKILNILVDQFELLDSMTPIEFLEFRGYLSAGSGFQSLQFRIIEMKLGLTDRFRSSFKTKYFTGTMFKGEQNVELEQAINEESLLIQIENGVAVETAERDVETSKRLFASMIDSSEYQKLLNNNERRISHKAMLAALMISLYHQQPCFQQAYQMLGLLMDVDALMASWRYKHMLMVQRQIGRKPGTGGTGGFSYLQQTIT